MDVPTLMYNLKEEVTCSVCIHLYTNPKQLPCLHIFCLECLNNLARTSTRRGKIKCPICETEVAVSETGTMETLPSCFYVKNLLDILAIKECNTSKVTCGNCDEKRDEASYCFHCGKFWCKECLNGHNILRENKEHRVISLKDFQDKDFEDVLKRPALCHKELHGKEVLKFHCKRCKVPACQTCVIVEHGGHDVEHLELAARAVKNSISCKLETVKESSQALANYVRELEEATTVFENRSQIIKRQIQETAKSLVATIQQQEQELTAKLENDTKTFVEDHMRSKATYRDQIKKNEELIKQAEHLLERSTGAELVRNKTVIDEIFQGFPKPQDIPSTTDGKTEAVFVQNEEISKFLQQSRIGQIVTKEDVTKASHCSVKFGFRKATVGLKAEFEVITRNPQGKQYYCPGDHVAVDIISTDEGRKVSEVKIVDNKNGNYAVSFVPNEVGQHLLIIQVNGDSIRDFPPIDITERSFIPVGFIGEGHDYSIPQNLLDLTKTTLLWKNLKPTSEVATNESREKINLGHPWGIAVNDLNEIFITDLDNDRIVVVNEKGDLIRSFGQNLVVKPTGICIDKEGQIFVASRGNNKILLFNSKGEFVMEVHKGGLLKEPRGISQDAQGNLIVCDAGNKCIQFISPGGNIFKTTGKGWLHMPNNCVFYKDKIFVSDGDAHRIKVYNDKGKFLYEFGSYGTGAGKLNKPTGLAVDKTGHLLVCSLGNNRVQIFTLDGRFVTKFGESGKDLGQMYKPCSVSVLNTGHIIISEFDNNRLQIFE